MRRKIIFLVIISVIILAGISFTAIKIYQGKTLNYIYVSKNPIKHNYNVGDKLDLYGLEITGVLKNGKTFIIDLAECEISNYDNLKPFSGLRVNIHYKGKNCTFGININEVPKPAKSLVSIEILESPKTLYKVGETLNTNNGVLLLKYNDNSTFRIGLLNRYVYGYPNPNDTPGTYTLQVKYTENGITCETSYDITVTE